MGLNLCLARQRYSFPTLYLYVYILCIYVQLSVLILHSLLTPSQVKAIVEKALVERENALRAEYDEVLQNLLQGIYILAISCCPFTFVYFCTEQYRNFAKFHEDYVSRQIKDRYAFVYLFPHLFFILPTPQSPLPPAFMLTLL